MDPRQIKRHQIIIHLVGCIEAADRQNIEDDHLVFFQNRPDPFSLPAGLIKSLLAGILHRSDILHQKEDQYRRTANRCSAQQKSQPQIILEQKTSDRRRHHEAQIRTEILQ